MNKTRFTIMLFLPMMLVTAVVYVSQKLTPPTSDPNAAVLQAQVEQSFGQLLLLFVENQGQWDEQVAYAAQGSDKTLYFSAEGVTFALTAPTAGTDERDSREERWSSRFLSKPVRTERWPVKHDFLGANPDVVPIGREQDSAVISY